MKDNFDKCLALLLQHEGGFVNHPSDPGGATNRGVTKKVWEEWIGKTVSIDDNRFKKALESIEAGKYTAEQLNSNYALTEVQLKVV